MGRQGYSSEFGAGFWICWLRGAALRPLPMTSISAIRRSTTGGVRTVSTGGCRRV